MGLRTKLVYTEHSRWQLEQLSPIKKLINRIFLSRTDGIVAISKQIEHYYLRNLFLSRKKVRLVLNGIDLDYYHRRDSQYLREKLGITKDARIIGTVANLRPEKNHKLLISAFSTVANKIEDVRLLLVGDDCMDQEVHRFAAQSGASDKILFLGRRNDVPELLSLFDIFCLPSIYEGLPLTLLEAMAAGVPVIGADVMGINEVVVNNQNGLLFPSNDEKRLTEMIFMLLSDNPLRNRLAEAGRESVERYYSLDAKVKEYGTLFHSIHNNSLLY
jgi:glycosyltransferase involved in cell wall biosynthesis